jgi:signal transduction histidine kinase
MHQTASLPAAAPVPAAVATVPAAISAADVTQYLITRYLIEDHDRIALRMNDVVIRRMFSAGLDLQLALGLIGDQRGAREICHALDELDHAIRDIRDIVFDLGPPAR